MKTMHRKIQRNIYSLQSVRLPKVEFDFQHQLTFESAAKSAYTESQWDAKRAHHALVNSGSPNVIQKPSSVLSKYPKAETPRSVPVHQKNSLNEATGIIEENSGLSFRDYIAKVNNQPSRESAKLKTEKGTLKSLIQTTNTESNHKVAAYSFNNSKVTTVEELSSFNNEYASQGYSHGLYKPGPLMSKQKLVQKVHFHEKFVEEVNQILPDKERGLFAFLEDSRISLLKHSEWFKDVEAQKNVYLLFTEAEEKWLQPFIGSELKILIEEKNRLEEEVKRKAVKEEAE